MARSYENPGAVGAATGASNDVRLCGEPFEVNPTSPNFQRSCRRVHALGPRVLCDLLSEIIAGNPDLEMDAYLLLARYEQLDPAMVKALGGDDWSTDTPHRIGRRDHGE
jgi:hypothetical protein